MKMRSRRGLWILVAVLVVMLAACGGTPEAEPDDDVDVEDPPAERILRFTMANVPHIDPAISADEAAAFAHLNLYDTLVFPLMDGSVIPHLAEDIEISPDGLEYTFQLREGVKFHNGDEVTADDVVFSMHRLLTIGQGWAYLFHGRLADYEAVDMHTVRFVLNEPYGPFLPSLVRLYIMNESEVMENVKDGVYGEYGDFGTEWLQTNAAGSGPYRVKEMRVGEHLWVELYEDYWNGHGDNSPTLSQLIGTTEPVTVRTMMARRELEVTDSYQPMENIDAMERIDGVEIARIPGSGMTELMVNTQIPPTDCVHIRRAMAYALDYEVIINEIYPGNPVADGVVSSLLAGSVPFEEPIYYDPERAIFELEQSPYHAELGETPITIAWVAEVPDREKIALLVQANMVEIGLEIAVERVPWTSLVERAADPEISPHISIVSHTPDYPEAGSVLDARWHSRGGGTWLQLDHLLNPEIDDMIDDALATPDWDERMSKYGDIQRRLEEMLPSIPLMQGMSRQAYQAEYIVWPSAEAVKAGGTGHPFMGYNFYIRDFEVYPDRIPD